MEKFIDSDILKNNPQLNIFIPMLYMVWADAVLTPSEINLIRNAINQQDWLAKREKEFVLRYLTPSDPPAPDQLKNWQQYIQDNAHNIEPNGKATLTEICLKLSEIHSGIKRTTQLESAVKEIHGLLGIAINESPYHLNNINHKTVIGELKSNPSFSPDLMSDILKGSQKETIDKVKNILSDPLFKYYDGEHKDEYREQVLQWCQYLAQQGFGSMAYPTSYNGGGDMEKYFSIMETLSYHDLSLVIKFGVQFGLWGMSVMFLGTEKHHKKYLEKIGTLELPGCFAMTETGHGSNVKGVETSATYNHISRTFEINTPHEAAGKEYIGNAAAHGKMATVFAKLLIDEVDYGVNAFVVPIREENGELSAGVRIEDCGLKMGLNGVDNGRIYFNKVTIPYDSMLDQYASIDDNGQFQSPITSDNRRFFTMLGTLVGGRIAIPRAGLSASKSGLSIAIKYADRRKQFGPTNGKEVSILNYRTHQRRLLPLLSNSYALHFALQYLTQRFLNRSENDMQEIEALAAGLKSWGTWNTTETLQQCREACGGKGYLSENRIDRLKNDSDIFTTFEGDNTVLMQLVAKSRLSEFKKSFSDIDFFGMLNYIAEKAKTGVVEMNPITTRNTDDEHLLDFDFHLNAFRYREQDVLTSAAKRFKKHMDSGMDSFDAFNQTQFHMLEVGKAYIERVILEQFVDQINITTDNACKTALSKVCQLFALTQIEKNKGWYLEHDYMNGSKTKAIRRMVNQLCWEVRLDAVPLVDAFDIPDHCLGAQIIVD